MLKILSVEDNPINAKLIHRYLRAFNAKLIDAQSGAEGIHLAHHERPDLVLMDIHLPDMSGKEAAARIHDLPDMADVPIVAITADDSPQLRQQCLENGFDAYITKPMSVGRLLRVVTSVIGLDGKRAV